MSIDEKLISLATRLTVTGVNNHAYYHYVLSNIYTKFGEESINKMFDIIDKNELQDVLISYLTMLVWTSFSNKMVSL
jgi:hypothetical protein